MGKGALLCYFAAAVLVAHGVPWALSRHLKSVQAKHRDSVHRWCICVQSVNSGVPAICQFKQWFFDLWNHSTKAQRAFILWKHWVVIHQIFVLLVFFVQHPNPNSRLFHSKHLVQPFARTETYFHSFFVDSVKLWNSLPNDWVNCSSVLSFKNSIKLPYLSVS